MFEMNGEKMYSMFLTEEEKIVIDAIRAGAKAELTFFDATFEEVIERTDQLPKDVFKTRYISDLTHGRIPFINVYVASKSIGINHYVDVTRKATDRRQA